MADPTKPRPYVARLPIGERLPLGEVASDDLFPLDGEIRVKPLEAPILPEPTRHGADGVGCHVCTGGHEAAVWRNERWRVLRSEAPSGLPIVLVLQPVADHDLIDLPDDLAGELGIMIQRAARAIQGVGGIGRVHVNRWGDGSEHFHVWFLARPAGMWQMRGAMLAVWDDILPPIPEDEWRGNLRTVAQALAEGGGEATPP